MKLWPYQVEAVEAARNVLRCGKKRFIIQASCGAGKTIVASEIISSAIDKGNNVLFICHFRQLAYQAMERFEKYGMADKVGFIMAGEQSNLDLPVQIASIQTYQRRLNLDDITYNRWFVDADIVIYDECHSSISRTRKAVLDIYKDRVIIGLTATPCRSDGRGLGVVYQEIVRCSNFAELQEQGYLVPVRYFGAEHEPDLDDIRLVAGDYNKKTLGERVDKPKLVGDILLNWSKIAPDRQTVIFATNVSHSLNIKEEFEKHGYSIEHIDAKTPHEERMDILRRFEQGDIQIVTNCEVFCLDGETEILTDTGWKSRNSISGKCKVANWKTDGEIFFKEPIKVIRRMMYPYEQIVSLKTKSVDIRVTDSHKMIYGHHNVPGKWHKKPAGELCGKNFVFPVCGECQPVKFGENHRIFLVNDSKGRYIARTSYDYRRRNKLCIEESKKIANEMWDLRSDIKTKLPHELSITECKFIGFWLGDGSVTRLQSGGLEYKVFQTKRYPQIIKYIDNLVEILNYDVIRRTSKSFLNGKRYHDLVTWSFPRGTGGKSQFRHGIFDIEPYLVKKGTAYFWGLNREQFIALLHGFSMADGGHGDVGFCRISNTNKQLLDLIQSIAVCRNISCSIFKRRGRLKKNHKQIYILQYLVDKRLHHVTTSRKRPGFQVEQECMEEVWCVTTQSKNIITRRNGKVCIMGNSEGADFPWVSCIILAKPSKSYARYVQKAGRVSRLYKGKTDGIIIDHARMIQEHGYLEDPVVWSLNDKKKAWSKPARDIKLKKMAKCRICHEIFNGLKACPRCGTELKTFGREIKTTDQELVELKAKKKRNRDMDWVDKRIFYGTLLYHAKEKGYKKGWAAHGYKSLMGVYPNDSRVKDVEPIKPEGKFQNLLKHILIKKAKSYQKRVAI